jgi:hypothetical protein
MTLPQSDMMNGIGSVPLKKLDRSLVLPGRCK